MSKVLLPKLFNGRLEDLPNRKLLINTINAHSYNVAKKDPVFFDALQNGDILLPDGVSVIIAVRLLFGSKIRKVAGADLFYFQMARLNEKGGTCFFLGSTDRTLRCIHNKVRLQYPNIKVSSYSPPFKPYLSSNDSEKMLEAVNSIEPDVLFIGMTAPKQEKWAYTNFDELHAQYICCIGAVFDFYAGNIKRAPQWMIRAGFEWLYRLLKEPTRLGRRYIIGNTKFVFLILKEKFKQILNFYSK